MDKIKGVNLGGWLVLEKWMTPHLFDNTKADDEYYLAHDLPHDIYKARIEQHRSNFITEEDILRISSLGLNLIRLPLPYFVFGDRKPFIGAIKYVDKIFNWAEAYDIKILLDLHTAPDSQNGFDNGGISGVCKWASEPDEVEFEKSVLKRLAERYGNREGLYGIEVLNEPATVKMFNDMQRRYKPRNLKMAEGSAPITFEFLYHYYQECYELLRSILPDNKVIMFHDGFDIDKWEKFFKKNEFQNVVLDTHQYLMMAELDNREFSVENYQKTITEFGKKIAKVSEYVPVVTGEWSLFNSYTAGIDTNGGINPTQQEFSGATHLEKEKLRKVYQILWKTQVNAWNQGIGYIYWTYKLNIDTINEPEWYGWDCWALQRVIDKLWLDPQDI